MNRYIITNNISSKFFQLITMMVLISLIVFLPYFTQALAQNSQQSVTNGDFAESQTDKTLRAIVEMARKQKEEADAKSAIQKPSFDAAKPTINNEYHNDITSNANNKLSQNTDLTSILKQIESKKSTPEENEKMLDSLLGMLPDDSALRQMIESVIGIMTNYNKDLLEATDAQ